MPTRIEIPYDRRFTDSQVEDEIARGTATVNVLDQLGAAYQSLPGYAMAGYQTEVNDLEALVTQLAGHVTAIRPLLESIDQKMGPLHDKNLGALRMLQGMLKTAGEKALLGQITGPIRRTPSPPPTPPGP